MDSNIEEQVIPGSPIDLSSDSDSDNESHCSETSELNEDFLCLLCNSKYVVPRILSCLHVFCTDCLNKQVESTDESSPDTAAKHENIIKCTVCKQATMLGMDGVDSLPIESVLEVLVKGEDTEDSRILCTSCKATETAVAQCSDCANFLCSGCVTAHQFMRCFDNHTVVSFETLKKSTSGKIIKPVFCERHPAEVVKSFCTACQVVVCSECMTTTHKDHPLEKVEDRKEKAVVEMKNLIDNSKEQLNFCTEATTALENSLAELQRQRDHAKSLIKETFQSYKAILEKMLETRLEELESLHNDQELHLMDMFHMIEKNVERIEDGCKLAERVLEHGTNTQILTLDKHISTQLKSMLSNKPRLDVTVNIEFDTDIDVFNKAVESSFGTFRKPAPVVTSNDLEHQVDDEELSKLQDNVAAAANLPANLPFDGTAFQMQNMLGADNVLASPEVMNSLQTLPPLSIPSLTSLASSLQVVSPQTINSIASSMQNLPNDKGPSRSSYSPMSDSGISLDAGSTSGSSNSLPYSTLAKMGQVSFDSQGQVLLNGSTLPGLSIKNITGIPSPAAASPRVQTPQQSDAALASLLSNMSTVDAGQNFNELINILNTPSILSTATAGSAIPPGAAPVVGMGGHTTAGTSAPITPLPGGSLTPESISAVPGIPSGHAIFSAQARRMNTKMSAMQIRCKFGQLGPGKGQFNSPHGFCLGVDEDIIVADTNNHRVQVFEKGGEFKYQFGIPGREEGQLWYPRKVAVMRDTGKYVVCDRGNERSRMQIFSKSGHFVKKIAIRYIDIVAGLAITPQGNIVAVDSVSPTVFCIAETGDLLKWFDCSDYMREPSDIAINQRDYYVCDFKGHCVVVFDEEGHFLRRIGCESITNFPNGIDISDAGDVLVGDSHGNRFHVAVFQRDGSLIGEFECPYVKVSRCCGLKITHEGFVVTLAKNNHHVLVLNTLYIQ